jgi:hypothetical protein
MTIQFAIPFQFPGTSVTNDEKTLSFKLLKEWSQNLSFLVEGMDFDFYQEIAKIAKRSKFLIVITSGEALKK